MEKSIIVVIGSGVIATAIARKIGFDKTILLADVNLKNAENAKEQLSLAGFDCIATSCDVSNRQDVQQLANQAASLGNITEVIHSAGLSPSQANPQMIAKVDLYGTALVLEIFGKLISQRGSGIVIGSQSSHRLKPLSIEQNRALAITPADELLNLEMITNLADSLTAYQLSKRGNALRVQAESLNWAKRGARLNCISAGIVYTPLAWDELNSVERGEFYRNMLDNLPVGRGGIADEIAELAGFIMGQSGGYITGADFLIDGGATAKYWWDIAAN